jgi:phospholipid transport system substrate-binding protein
MTIANYAKSFDSFGGEKFTVEPASIARGSDHFVKSSLKTSNDTIAFNYRLHQTGSDWKITDVYLAGNISQMAQKRSDFAATLASGGPQGLTKKINAITDQILG